MKKRLQFAIFLWVCGIGTTGAQITLTANNYPYGPGTDTYYFMNNASNVSLPEEGADKTYDYANLRKDAVENSINYDGSKNEKFPEATTFGKTRYEIAGYEYRVHQYFALDEKSMYGVGRTQFDSTHSLVAVTGNAADEIHFPTAHIRYPNTCDYIKFPMSYGDAWTETETEVSQFELTIAAFGLNKTPGTAVKNEINERKVVGYGKLIIPKNDGTPSAPIEVLLVKIKVTSIDSVFLGGAPAPAPLLAAFNFTQGTVTTSYVYTFEMLDFGRQPLTLYYTPDGKATFAQFRPNAAEVSTSTKSLVGNTSVYPTLLQAGGVLSFDLDTKNQVQEAQLLSLQGSTVALEAIGDGKFRIPTNLAPGMYAYVAKNATAAPIARGKVTIIQ